MDAPPLPSRSSGSKKHNRNASYNRTPLPRRTTKGPLDNADDPPAPDSTTTTSEASSTTDSITADAVNTPIPSAAFSPERGYSIPTSIVTAASSSPPKPASAPPSKDLSFLLRASIYHTLPPPLHPSRQTSTASTETPLLPTLLKTHNYRAAATHSATRLSTPPPPPNAEILSLFYTRLASLVRLSLTPLAAAESLALDDSSGAFYRTPDSNNILPWHLRSLLARLASIAHNDPRRGVTAFYDLAREARVAVAKAKTSRDGNGEEGEVWRQRLQECGIGVANVLVEAGDLELAGRCLEGMRVVGGRQREGEMSEEDGGGGGISLLDTRLALTYLSLGDVEAAKRCCGGGGAMASASGERTSTMLQALTLIAEGKYEDAAAMLRAMPQQQQDDAVQVNLAVCLFYMGRKDETMAMLEGLVDQGGAAGERREVSFNLATCFELSCERAVGGRKRELVERVERRMRERGWEGEMVAADFKL